MAIARTSPQLTTCIIQQDYQQLREAGLPLRVVHKREGLFTKTGRAPRRLTRRGSPGADCLKNPSDRRRGLRLKRPLFAAGSAVTVASVTVTAVVGRQRNSGDDWCGQA